MLIADAHLDLAFNALNGRDVLLPASQQPANEDGIATAGLPDLRNGNVGLVCATIFCEPATWKSNPAGYSTPDQAHALALAQLHWYQQQHRANQLQFVLSPTDLPPSNPETSNLNSEISNPKSPIPFLLLLEGADPLRSPDDAHFLHAAGLRIVGLAWKRTRYAGGTGDPGPLTPDGIDLLKTLDRLRIIHDTSHLAEQSFWDLLRLSDGPVIASHSNCRSIIPTDRQLSDDMIRALVSRGGVIGINLYDKFLLPPHEYGQRRAALADLIPHIRHICDLAGDTLHVGLGSDLDGGFGRDQIPQELTTAADLPLIESALTSNGFTPADAANILAQNWLRFFHRNLPASN